jgi:hypothetical protein
MVVTMDRPVVARDMGESILSLALQFIRYCMSRIEFEFGTCTSNLITIYFRRCVELVWCVSPEPMKSCNGDLSP